MAQSLKLTAHGGKEKARQREPAGKKRAFVIDVQPEFLRARSDIVPA
jgi:hypothetical protein